MNENTFQLDGRNYKLSKINAFKQFHIVRRVAPILADLIPIAQKFSNMKGAELESDQLEALAPIADGIAKLKDDDADKVLIGLLESVEVQQEQGNWSKIAVNGQLAFQNLELKTMLALAGKAFMFNMAGFFTVLPQVSPGRGE